MTKTELEQKMREFIKMQDDTSKEEWWCTPQDLYRGVLYEFGQTLNIDLLKESDH